jgi:hypothetical protein
MITGGAMCENESMRGRFQLFDLSHMPQREDHRGGQRGSGRRDFPDTARKQAKSPLAH